MSKEKVGTSKQGSGGILKSLRYGSGMLVDGVLAVTPHWAGAVDIMAVRQMDGSIQSSPFYVRFGKYQSWRWNRQVQVKVNGQLMNFTLELGSFGSAFFAHEQEQEYGAIAEETGNPDDDPDDTIHQGMMSPVAAYEANYMSMVAASSPDLPTGPLMHNADMHHGSQSQPNLAPMMNPNTRHSPLNGMHGSHNGSHSCRAAVDSDAELASDPQSTQANPGHSGPCDSGAGVPEALVNYPQCHKEVGHSTGAKEVLARRLPDVRSRESMSDMFVSGAECGEDGEASALVDSHAISAGAVSQPATPDWHALDRSCWGSALPSPAVPLQHAGASLATAACSSFESVQTGSEGFFADSQRLPEGLEAVAEEHDTSDMGQGDVFMSPRVVGTAAVSHLGQDWHASTPDTVVANHALHSYPVSAGDTSGATACYTSTDSPGEHLGVARGRNSEANSAATGLQEQEQAVKDTAEGALPGTRGQSVLSSAKSLATLAEDIGCNEAKMLAPARPLSGEGVDVQLIVESLEQDEEYVRVMLNTWVRPVRLSFSATQLAAIRTSLEQPRNGSSTVEGSSNGAISSAAKTHSVHRNSLVFHPTAQPMVQSPTMPGIHSQGENKERHVQLPDWESPDAHGDLHADHGNGHGAPLGAASPCAQRMAIGAEAMHGEEECGLDVTQASANVNPRLTANADTLCTAVEEEHEQGVASGEPHDAYRGITPDVELSACAHLLTPDMPESALAQAFDEHRVHATNVADQGVAALQMPNLAVRVGDSVYRYTDAQPLMLALLTFGGPAKQWRNLMPEEEFKLPPKTIEPEPKKMQRRRTWWASIFFGASSQEANKEVLTAADHGLLQEDLEHGPLVSADGSVADDLFSTNAEEMRRAAGEMDAVEGHLEHHSRDPLDSEGGPSGASMPSPEGAGEGKPQQQPTEKRRRTIKVHSTHPTSKQLEAMAEHLQLGQNTVEFISGNQCVQSFIHLFNWNIRLVISDIDGTITRSDVLGHVLPPFGVDWSHPGVTRLFSNVAANGYQFVYLSSRSIAQSGITRAFLETLKQQEHGLPNGPVIISPHGIIPSLYREMILKRPQEFKMAALQGIRSLFPEDWNPFFCGFGNRPTDEASYQHVGIPDHRIFTINPSGKVRQLSEPETSERFNSLSKIDEQVDLLFPVTETARQRLFAQQVSMRSRTSQCGAEPTDIAAESSLGAAPVAMDVPSGNSPTAAGASDTVQGTSAATASASSASGDDTAPFSAPPCEDLSGTGEALSVASSPTQSAPIPIPTHHSHLESLRSMEGMARFTSVSSTLPVEMSMSFSPPRGGGTARALPAVDVDAREEFTDFNYWKMDSVYVSAELEGLIAQDEAEEQQSGRPSPTPGTAASSSVTSFAEARVHRDPARREYEKVQVAIDELEARRLIQYPTLVDELMYLGAMLVCLYDYGVVLWATLSMNISEFHHLRSVLSRTHRSNSG